MSGSYQEETYGKQQQMMPNKGWEINEETQWYDTTEKNNFKTNGARSISELYMMPWETFLKVTNNARSSQSINIGIDKNR